MERMVFHMFGPFEDDLGHLNRLVELVEPTLLNPADRELVIFLSSKGGANRHASIVFNYLIQLPFPVTMIAVGEVGSAAFYVYLAGQKRLAVPYARFMIHGGTITVQNAPRAELRRILREFDLEMASQVDILQTRCNITARLARAWLRSGQAFSAEDARRFGIAHEIIDRPYLGE